MRERSQQLSQQAYDKTVRVGLGEHAECSLDGHRHGNQIADLFYGPAIPEQRQKGTGPGERGLPAEQQFIHAPLLLQFGRLTLNDGIEENHSVDSAEANAEDAGLLSRRCCAAEEEQRHENANCP